MVTNKRAVYLYHVLGIGGKLSYGEREELDEYEEQEDKRFNRYLNDYRRNAQIMREKESRQGRTKRTRSTGNVFEMVALYLPTGVVLCYTKRSVHNKNNRS